MLLIPVNQLGTLPLDDVPEFVSGDVDKFNTGTGVGIDRVELAGGWRNCSNVSPEGILKRFPDSRKSVRQFNGCIGITPVSPKSTLHQCSVHVNGVDVNGVQRGTNNSVSQQIYAIR